MSSSLSVETLSSLAFDSSLGDASDSEVTAMSLLGLACVVLIFLSMLLVNAAGEPMPPMPPSANRTPTACQPAPGFPPHGNLSGVEHSGGWAGPREGARTGGASWLSPTPRAFGSSN
jgi:hypothetical protein